MARPTRYIGHAPGRRVPHSASCPRRGIWMRPLGVLVASAGFISCFSCGARQHYPHRGSADGKILGRATQRDNREAGLILARVGPPETARDRPVAIQEHWAGSRSDRRRAGVSLSSVCRQWASAVMGLPSVGTHYHHQPVVHRHHSVVGVLPSPGP
jgi:hypothetical protein